MDIKQYISHQKRVYISIVTYLENRDDDHDYSYLNDLIKIVKTQNLLQDKEELGHFLRLILNLIEYHHRDDEFINKIKKILITLKDDFKQILSNHELFQIFSKSKLILLYLFDEKIIISDKIISKYILYKYESNNSRYCHFFYPEIKQHVEEEELKNIEDELKSIDDEIFTEYEEKRHLGENDSYICSLIRNDSIEEFITYVSKMNISLNSTIKPSIFETHKYLIENESTNLIEYAAFFGSIQIFQYLRLNDVELQPSLWSYAIHSNNAEMIHLLEQKQVQPPDSFKSCLLESIKCNHNDFANYIQNNLLPKDQIDLKDMKDNVIEYAFRYSNYLYLPNEYDKSEFYHFCYYKYSKIVNQLIDANEKKFGDYYFSCCELKAAANSNDYELIYFALLLKDILSYFSFENNRHLKRIVIPPNIYSISPRLFRSCKSLTQVLIPPPVTSIGTFAFSNCISLKEIAFPSSLASISHYAFNGCKSLVAVTIPSSVKTIEEGAFMNCSSLKQIVLPIGLTKISSNTFQGCSSLKDAIIPSSVTEIGTRAFSKCYSLQQITIPSSVTIICKKAFHKCSSLEKINLSSTLKTIKWFAFDSCNSLNEICIPSSVEVIEDNAFQFCRLENITFEAPSSLRKIGAYCFYNCSWLKEISFPPSIKKIGNYCFYLCTSLKQVMIPKGLNITGATYNCQGIKVLTLKE